MPPADTAVKITNTLGTSVEYLATGNKTGVRLLIKNLLRLDTKDRKITTILINALPERH
jgi:hypothetical protein